MADRLDSRGFVNPETVHEESDVNVRALLWAMVIFVTSSLALIGWGFMQPHSEGIGVQNVILLAINGVGVWRYLIRPAPKRK